MIEAEVERCPICNQRLVQPVRDGLSKTVDFNECCIEFNRSKNARCDP